MDRSAYRRLNKEGYYKLIQDAWGSERVYYIRIYNAKGGLVDIDIMSEKMNKVRSWTREDGLDVGQRESVLPITEVEWLTVKLEM